MGKGEGKQEIALHAGDLGLLLYLPSIRGALGSIPNTAENNKTPTEVGGVTEHSFRSSTQEAGSMNLL